MSCVFCDIRDGRLPATWVAESQRALAVMDIHPRSTGHALIIPKVHVETLFTIADEDLEAAIHLVRRVAGGIRRGLAPDGLTVLQVNGAAAHQSVPHLHFHLIPRRHGDGLGFDWPLVPGDPEALQAAAARIRAAL